MAPSRPSAAVVLVHWGSTGGGPRFLLEMAQALAAEGDARLGLSFNSRADVSVQLSTLVSQPHTTTTYRSRVGVILGLIRLPLISWRFRSYLRRFRPTTVVCVMDSVYQSLVVPLSLPRSVKYVVCLHDADLHPGEDAYVRRVGRWLELRRADHVVTFNSLAQESVSSRRPGTPVSCLVHPALGVEHLSAPVPRLLPTERPIIIGFAGRLTEYKGVDMLLGAARLIRETFPDVEIHIHGEGPLRTLAELEASGAVNWHIGWIPEGGFASVVTTFDVLVLPYTEASQSGVLAQALALGVPTVVTPVGGLAEQALNSGGGTVAKDVSAAAVAEAIVSLLSDPERYEALSRQALRAASTDYSWAAFMGQSRDRHLWQPDVPERRQ